MASISIWLGVGSTRKPTKAEVAQDASPVFLLVREMVTDAPVAIFSL